MRLINDKELTLYEATEKCIKAGSLKVPHLYRHNGVVYEYIIKVCED